MDTLVDPPRSAIPGTTSFCFIMDLWQYVFVLIAYECYKNLQFIICSQIQIPLGYELTMEIHRHVLL